MNAFWYALIVTILAIKFGTVTSNNDFKAIIIPSGRIVKTENEDLNLSCVVNSRNKKHKYTLSWILPSEADPEKSRRIVSDGHNMQTLNIRQVKMEDSGTYTCNVNSNNLNWKYTATVQVKPVCSDKLFSCGGGICIPLRYACDGYIDCKNMNDESVAECGEYPCDGKIHCDDGRCIPKSFCCDQEYDPNCMHTVPCCHKYITRERIVSSSSPMQQHHYSDINFLQSTIYTIVSCAIAFIFITTIMVVAICRIHMRRSVMSLPSQRNRIGTNRRLRRWPWYLFRLHRRESENSNPWQTRCQIIYPNLGNEETLLGAHQTRAQVVPYSCSLSTHGSFIVTYSNSDGVQLVEHLPKPPPYGETSDSTVHWPPFITNGIPPPPYQSVEELHTSEESELNTGPPEISSADNDQVIVVHMTSSNLPSLRLENNNQQQ